MSREIYQKVGLIVALVIAGVSLPVSIISLSRPATIINNDYYNTYYNQTYYGNNGTTITTVQTEYHSITNQNFEAIVFNYSEGDKMIAVWDCTINNYVDVFFINKQNFQLFIDGMSFTTVLSAINSSSGFFEYEIVVPDLYFMVFYTNYSNVYISYQVTQYHYDGF